MDRLKNELINLINLFICLSIYLSIYRNRETGKIRETKGREAEQLDERKINRSQPRDAVETD